MSFNFIRENKIHAKIKFLQKFPNLQYFVQTPYYKYMYYIKLLLFNI